MKVYLENLNVQPITTLYLYFKRWAEHWVLKILSCRGRGSSVSVQSERLTSGATL